MKIKWIFLLLTITTNLLYSQCEDVGGDLKPDGKMDTWEEFDELPCGLPNCCYVNEDYPAVPKLEYAGGKPNYLWEWRKGPAPGNNVNNDGYRDTWYHDRINQNYSLGTETVIDPYTGLPTEIEVLNLHVDENVAPYIPPQSADFQFSGSELQSKWYFVFGKFELRCKLPPNNLGLWPAFWLYGGGDSDWSEIDIFEFFGNDTQTTNIINYQEHCPFTGERLVSSWTEHIPISAPEVNPNLNWEADSFNTYTCEWDPYKISFSINGVEFRTVYKYYKKTIHNSGTTYEGIDCLQAGEPLEENEKFIENPAFLKQESMRLLITSDVHQENISETTNDSGVSNISALPNKVVVDYVKVWQKPSLDDNNGYVRCETDPEEGNSDDCCYGDFSLQRDISCREKKFEFPGPTLPHIIEWTVSGENYDFTVSGEFDEFVTVELKHDALDNDGILRVEFTVLCDSVPQFAEVDLSAYFLNNNSYTIISTDISACDFYAEVEVYESLRVINIEEIKYIDKWGGEHALPNENWSLFNSTNRINIHYPPYTRNISVETDCGSFDFEVPACTECCPMYFESNGDHCRTDEFTYPGFTGLVLNNTLYAIPNCEDDCECPPGSALVPAPFYGSLCSFSHTVDPNYNATAWGNTFYTDIKCLHCCPEPSPLCYEIEEIKPGCIDPEVNVFHSVGHYNIIPAPATISWNVQGGIIIGNATSSGVTIFPTTYTIMLEAEIQDDCGNTRAISESFSVEPCTFPPPSELICAYSACIDLGGQPHITGIYPRVPNMNYPYCLNTSLCVGGIGYQKFINDLNANLSSGEASLSFNHPLSECRGPILTITGSSTPFEYIEVTNFNPQTPSPTFHTFLFEESNCNSGAPESSNRSLRFIDLKIYPNPVADILFLDSSEEIEELSIYSLDGKLIIRHVGNIDQLNTSEMQSGIYLLQIKIGAQVESHKIFK